MTDVALRSSRFAQGDFRIGHVLSLAWSLFCGNFLKFSLVTGIAASPWLLVPPPTAADAGNPFANLRVIIISMMLSIVLNIVSQAIVLYGAFQGMRRRPVSLADGLKVGLSRFLALMGVVAILLLALGAVTFATIFVVSLVDVPALTYASFLLIIPIGMLLLTWSMATPNCVVERTGPFRSLARSRALTKGHRWKLLWLFLVTMIPGVIVGGIVGAATGAAGVLVPDSGLPGAALQTLSLIWNSVWGGFFAVAIAVAYRDLRVASEGIDTEEIAAVFE
jgi:hypothetical protein